MMVKEYRVMNSRADLFCKTKSGGLTFLILMQVICSSLLDVENLVELVEKLKKLM